MITQSLSLTDKELANIVGGKRNGWGENLTQLVGTVTSTAKAGNFLCGPGCGLLGGLYGGIGWAAVTGLTGGFGSTHKKIE